MLLFFIVFLAVLILLSILGNILVIFSAIFNKKLRKYTHFLIMNLALSDLLISSFSLTLRLLRLIASKDMSLFPHLSSEVFCRYTTCLTISLFASSNFNLLLLTADRFFAINHALYYKLFFKRRHMCLLIAISWVLAFATGMTPAMIKDIQTSDSDSKNDLACTYASVIDQNYTVFVIIFTFFAPLSVMIVFYASIIKKVRSTHSSYEESSQRHPQMRTSLTPAAIKRRERRISMGILCLLGAHTVLLAPISILDLVQVFGRIKTPSLAIEICLLLTYTNPVVNAPVYAAASKDYYKTFTELLCCFGRLRALSRCRAENQATHRNPRYRWSPRVRVKRSRNIWYITTTISVPQD